MSADKAVSKQTKAKRPAKAPTPTPITTNMANGHAHCATVAGRKAAAVDPEIKAATLRRLTRIEGQVRGLHKMVESERYCADILVQISSVQEALRGVSQQLMRNHLRHCASDAIREGPAAAESMYDELLDLVYRHAR